MPPFDRPLSCVISEIKDILVEIAIFSYPTYIRRPVRGGGGFAILPYCLGGYGETRMLLLPDGEKV